MESICLQSLVIDKTLSGEEFCLSVIRALRGRKSMLFLVYEWENKAPIKASGQAFSAWALLARGSAKSSSLWDA